MVNKTYCVDNPAKSDVTALIVEVETQVQRWRRYYQSALHGPSRASTLLERVRQLPEIDLANVIKNQPLLVVAPHPDDESLGCGGMIAEAGKLGGRVHIVVVTDGARSHPQSRTHPKDRLRSIRRSETIEAASVLGVPAGEVSFLDVPDGHAPRSGAAARAIGQRLASLARGISAKTIFTSWDFDSHPDHAATYAYACFAAEKLGMPLFSYPVWAWMLPPDTIVPNIQLKGFSLDIGASMATKRAAVLRHRSQTTAMIADDPTGFTLSDEHLNAMITSREFFILKPGQAPHIAGLE